VVRDLMDMIFRVKLFFDANAILITFSTLLLMGLVIILSLRLRQKEMQTMFKIGCSRGTIAMLQIWEMTIVFLIAVSYWRCAFGGSGPFLANWSSRYC
jgi:putative ABC transport system permease protein